MLLADGRSAHRLRHSTKFESLLKKIERKAFVGYLVNRCPNLTKDLIFYFLIKFKQLQLVLIISNKNEKKQIYSHLQRPNELSNNKSQRIVT